MAHVKNFRFEPTEDSLYYKQVVSPTETQPGHRIYFFNPDVELSEEFSETLRGKISYLSKKKKNCIRVVVIQIAKPNEKFADIKEDRNIIVLPFSSYIYVLKFFKHNYPKISAALEGYGKEMREGETEFAYSSTLYFKGPGIATHTYQLTRTNTYFNLCLEIDSKEGSDIRVYLQHEDKHFGTSNFDLSVYAFSLLHTLDYDLLCKVTKYKPDNVQLDGPVV